MKKLTLLYCVLWFAGFGLPTATAQTGGVYDLTWNTFDGGGGTSTGGIFSLTGTIGQHDTTLAAASGGDYIISSGFWASTGLLCFVDFFDYANFASEWMFSGPGLAADLNNDLNVDSDDLGILAENWLMPCPFSNWEL